MQFNQVASAISKDRNRNFELGRLRTFKSAESQGVSLILRDAQGQLGARQLRRLAVVQKRDTPEWRDRELRHEHFETKALLQHSNPLFKVSTEFEDSYFEWEGEMGSDVRRSVQKDQVMSWKKRSDGRKLWQKKYLRLYFYHSCLRNEALAALNLV